MNYEEIIIGTIVSGETDIIYRISEEDFLTSIGKKVFCSARDLHQSGKEINAISLSEHTGNNLLPYLERLPNISLRFSAVDAMRRERAYREAKAFNPKEFSPEEIPFKMIEKAREIQKLMNSDSESICNFVEELNKKIERFPTGFVPLDCLLDGGIETGAVMTVGGIPGDGKTAFATHLTANALHANRKVHFITLEMDRWPLVRRIMKAYWDATDADFRGGIDESLKMTGELTVSSTLTRLSDVVASMSKHLDAELIVIDYAQKIRDGNFNDNRVSEIESVFGTLTNFAREFKIPILVLSQLNRDYKSDRNDPPQAYHMKGSGAIEADSHIVALLHNPNAKEESDASTLLNGKNESVRDDERVLYVRKNRNGRIGAIGFIFDKKKSMFKEDRFYQPSKK